MVPTEVPHEMKTTDTKKVAVHEEELQVKQRSPITILSDDEGYLLEEEKVEKTSYFRPKTRSRNKLRLNMKNA